MIKKWITILFSLTLLVVLIIGYARFVEPNLLIVKTVDAETEKSIKPCKIVFFTDTHFGKYYTEKHMERIVTKINNTNPDIIIFGGDLLDNYARDRDTINLDYLKDEFRKLNASIGKYAVWGNHDYGGGAVRIYEEFITDSGFELLNDESRTLKEYGIKIIGYDDNLMGWTDPSLYKLESSLFNIIAAHEPVVSQYVESNSENFLLSGHTHGGQVTIPFVTEKLLPKGSGQFLKGYYTKEEINTAASLEMYTSSGIGMTRYPFRFLNPPEIVVINLQTAD